MKELDIIGRVIGEHEVKVEPIGDTGINIALVELECAAQPSGMAIWLRDSLIVIAEYIIQNDDKAHELFDKVIAVISSIEDPFRDRAKADKTLTRVDAVLQGKIASSKRNIFYHMYS
jgi:hypothetical protein